ncbi:hypothetical protein T4A_12418 [Trichinella pseudospiralis]|uniref:Uncharacterized protein n=1 Tax=Trichinella pseudospiralis TaxID=6337 RepID=A0A0V1DQR1_TRIPS|nr:hypothetical protein T4A_12418 [Trichinella pseudospiralis]
MTLSTNNSVRILSVPGQFLLNNRTCYMRCPVCPSAASIVHFARIGSPQNLFSDFFSHLTSIT